MTGSIVSLQHVRAAKGRPNPWCADLPDPVFAWLKPQSGASNDNEADGFILYGSQEAPSRKSRD